MNRLMLTMSVTLTFALATATVAVAGDDCCPEGAAAADAAAAAGPAAPTTMPAGHPPVDPAAQPTTQAGSDHAMSGALGTLVVKVSNGTADGPVPAGAPVSIEFYRRGKLYHQTNTKLDETGVVMVENIAIQDVIQPVVNVLHAGVTYRKVAHPMAAVRPDQVVKMKVYQPADEQPEWVGQMRHVFTRVGPHGLEVTEVLVIDNPTDRAWAGHPADDGGKPYTIEMPVPKDAKFVQFGEGTDPAQMQIVPGKVISHMPLLPGGNQIAVGYVVPIHGDAASVALPMACDVEHTMLIVPDDGSDVTVTGLSGGKTMAGKGDPVRVYQGMKLKQGAAIDVSFKGLKAAQPTPGAGEGAAAPAGDEEHLANQSAHPGSSHAPKIVAGVGGAGLLVAAVVLILFRGSGKTAQA